MKRPSIQASDRARHHRARLLAVYMSCVLPAAAALRGPVPVSGGLVAGAPARDPGISVFLGIPYGAPPVGDLRWRPPQPPLPWTGVRTADHFCASCIQNIVTERKPWTHEFMAHNEISEDCLFLNVWTPAKSPRERHPVFIWIHGGGNNEGSASVPIYDGEGLAKKGLVVVAINYRLGVLGWMSHPELTRESPQHASGNYGLLDQIAAVKWVHDNIAGFGGDPGNVTVAGQSAGAGAVHNLSASPLAKGLFHRTIAESGSGVVGFPPRTTADQEQDGLRFAAAKGAKSLADLRAMSWGDLVAPVPGTAANPATGATAGWRFGPVVDGYSLPLSVKETFSRGLQNDVPMLTGGNADEGGATPKPEVTADEFQKQAKQRFGDLADTFLQLYPAKSDAEAGAARNAQARDQSRTSTYLWALQRAQTAKTPVYSYYWNHALPGVDAAMYGAFHTSEVPYALATLDNSDRPFTETDHRIAALVSSYWVNFATKGNPNGRGLPHWPAVSAQSAMTMQLGDETGPIPVSGSEAKLNFWRQILTNATAAPAGAAPIARP